MNFFKKNRAIIDKIKSYYKKKTWQEIDNKRQSDLT